MSSTPAATGPVTDNRIPSDAPGFMTGRVERPHRSVWAYLTALRRLDPRRTAAVLGLSTVISLTEGAGLLLLVPLLGEGGAQAASQGGARSVVDALGVPGLLGLCLALVAIRSVLALIRDVTRIRLSQGFTDHVRTSVFEAIGQSGWTFLTTCRSPALLHAVTIDALRVGTGTGALLQIITTGLLAGAYIAVTLLTAPIAGAIAILLALVLLATLAATMRRSTDIGTALVPSGQALFADASEFLGAMKVAKAFNAEADHARRFDARVASLREYLIAQVTYSGRSRAILTVVSTAIVVAVIGAGLATGRASGADLALIAIVGARLSPLVTGLQQQVHSVLFMIASFDHQQRLLDACRAESEPARSGTPLRFERELRLEQVGFRYPERDEVALRDVTLSIPARTLVAITGPSGAGKTTLGDLVLGLHAPTSGHVTCDGAALTASRRRDWREHVAYVPQEPDLFAGTLRENLAWAAPEAGDPILRTALETAGMGSLARLPDALDRDVGDRGRSLSGGERQRVAIARALLREPDLMLLDEPTSALDEATQDTVIATLLRTRQERTIVVITHNARLTEAADVVFRVERGSVDRIKG